MRNTYIKEVVKAVHPIVILAKRKLVYANNAEAIRRS